MAVRARRQGEKQGVGEEADLQPGETLPADLQKLSKLAKVIPSAIEARPTRHWAWRRVYVCALSQQLLLLLLQQLASLPRGLACSHPTSAPPPSPLTLCRPSCSTSWRCAGLTRMATRRSWPPACWTTSSTRYVLAVHVSGRKRHCQWCTALYSTQLPCTFGLVNHFIGLATTPPNPHDC